MKLTLNDIQYLKEPILVISDLVNEATFKVDKDKIELIAMDPANVAMVVFRLLSTAFSEYNVNDKEELSLNLDSLKQILRRAKPEDILTLELIDNKLKIELKSDSTRVFHLSLLNLEDKPQKIPDLKFPLKIETNTLLFDEAIGDSDIVSDSVAFLVEPEKFTIEAIGTLTTSKVDLMKSNETLIETNGKFKAKYSLEYLKKIIKASKLTDKVMIQFSKDYPLKVDYKVVDKLGLTFILAPRVSND